MDKLKSTAKKLDVFFHIMQVLFVVAAVASLVGLALIAACFVFQLDPELVGTGYNALDLGFLELELADSFAPDKHHVLLIAAVELAMAAAASILGRHGMTCVRRLLAPMKEGCPFHAAAASGLKRLAVLSLVLGILLNVSELANYVLSMRCYRLTELFISDKIMHASFNFKIDFTFLLISGILLMLSYIFRYGQELQQLSDETL